MPGTKEDEQYVQDTLRLLNNYAEQLQGEVSRAGCQKLEEGDTKRNKLLDDIGGAIVAIDTALPGDKFAAAQEGAGLQKRAWFMLKDARGALSAKERNALNSKVRGTDNKADRQKGESPAKAKQKDSSGDDQKPRVGDREGDGRMPPKAMSEDEKFAEDRVKILKGFADELCKETARAGFAKMEGGKAKRSELMREIGGMIAKIRGTRYTSERAALAGADSVKELLKRARKEIRAAEDSLTIDERVNLQQRHEGNEMADLVENPKLCAKCGAPDSSSKCPCKQVQYCSKECQVADWPSHKLQCRARLDKKVNKAKKQHGREDEAVAKARMDAGDAYGCEGRYGEAERCFVEARRIFTAVHGDDHSDVARACAMLGQAYDRMGRYEEAAAVLKEGLGIFRRTLGKRSYGVGDSLQMMGKVLRSQGKYEEALERLEEAHGIMKGIYGPDNAIVASVLSDKGNTYDSLGQLDKALEMHQEALRICRLVHGDGSEGVAVAISRLLHGDGSEGVANALANIGTIFSKLGRHAEARANHEEALGIHRRLHGEKHPNVGNALSSIGDILDKHGEYDEALKLYRKALKIRRHVYGEDHQEVAGTQWNIGSLLFRQGNALREQGKYDEAVEVYEEALGIYTRALGVDNETSAGLHFSLAEAKDKSGDVAGALESARESVRIYDKLGITDEYSHYAGNLLMRLEGIE